MKEPIRKLGNTLDPTVIRQPRLVVAALLVRQALHGVSLGYAASPESGGAVEAVGGLEVLICQRRPDQPMSLKWEFPGGKVEPGETSEQALARELNEELGITATIGSPVAEVSHRYRNGGALQLRFFMVREFAGEIENRIFNQILWTTFDQLPGYDFLAADLGLIRDLAHGKLLPEA